MVKVTIYKQSSCGVCREIVPLLKKLSKEKGIKLKVIDVDKCHTKECDDVKAIPKIMVDGREIQDMRELKKIFT